MRNLFLTIEKTFRTADGGIAFFSYNLVPCWQVCHTGLHPELVKSSPYPTIFHQLLYLLSVCT